MATLTRFWIEFEDRTEPSPSGTVAIDDTREAVLSGGCGVTAWDFDDALDLVESVFASWSEEPLPNVVRVVENVDVSGLPDHVTQYIGVTAWRGVWFPRFNLLLGAKR